MLGKTIFGQKKKSWDRKKKTVFKPASFGKGLYGFFTVSRGILLASKKKR